MKILVVSSLAMRNGYVFEIVYIYIYIWVNSSKYTPVIYVNMTSSVGPKLFSSLSPFYTVLTLENSISLRVLLSQTNNTLGSIRKQKPKQREVFFILIVLKDVKIDFNAEIVDLDDIKCW